MGVSRGQSGEEVLGRSPAVSRCSGVPRAGRTHTSGSPKREDAQQPRVVEVKDVGRSLRGCAPEWGSRLRLGPGRNGGQQAGSPECSRPAGPMSRGSSVPGAAGKSPQLFRSAPPAAPAPPPTRRFLPPLAPGPGSEPGGAPEGASPLPPAWGGLAVRRIRAGELGRAGGRGRAGSGRAGRSKARGGYSGGGCGDRPGGAGGFEAAAAPPRKRAGRGRPRGEGMLGGPGYRPRPAWAGAEGGPCSPGGWGGVRWGRAPRLRPVDRLLPPGGRAFLSRSPAGDPDAHADSRGSLGVAGALTFGGVMERHLGCNHQRGAGGGWVRVDAGSGARPVEEGSRIQKKTLYWPFLCHARPPAIC